MTLRAFLIGLLISVLVSLWPSYTTYILRSARADYAHLSVAILLPFLLLLLVNLYFSHKSKGLTPSELILIASMGMVSALTQGEWLAGYFLGVITAPIYFASPKMAGPIHCLRVCPIGLLFPITTPRLLFTRGCRQGRLFRGEAGSSLFSGGDVSFWRFMLPICVLWWFFGGSGWITSVCLFLWLLVFWNLPGNTGNGVR